MKAASAATDLGVFPVVGERGRYHVRSSGKAAVLYLVDLDDADNGCGCGCRGFEIRSGMMLYPAPDCKHILVARFYQYLQRRFERKSV